MVTRMGQRALCFASVPSGPEARPASCEDFYAPARTQQKTLRFCPFGLRFEGLPGRSSLVGSGGERGREPRPLDCRSMARQGFACASALFALRFCHGIATASWPMTQTSH